MDDLNDERWDKLAPVAFLFVIGLVVGYILGMAVGADAATPDFPLLISLPPIAIILAAFILFDLLARRKTRRPG